MKDLQTSNPEDHIQNVKSGLQELVDHLRRDIEKVEEPHQG